MITRYDILQFVSQREDGEMSSENERLVSVADVIRRTSGYGGADEAQACSSSFDVGRLNEREKRCAESWAKENGLWIPMEDIFRLGKPGPCGSESDTYLSSDGYIYKTNNLMHCGDSIIATLSKFILYNIAFPDSAYSFVGFAGFEGRSVFPIVRQPYIKNGEHATQNEIDCYMSAIGFEKISLGRYENSFMSVWDVLPKNVLKDESGDIFIIDVELALKG